MRRTKILATLGPASETESELSAMIEQGLNAVRCNFSHGSAEDHQARVDLVRETAAKMGKRVGILADLQGPKIRVSRFVDGKVTLAAGDVFILDANFPVDAGTAECVGIDYKNLPQDVASGDILLLDDGRLVFEVQRVDGSQIHCLVREGGDLSNNKGINKQGGGLTAPALTDKDKADLKTAASLGVDFIAVSFPRDASDILEARTLLTRELSSAGIIAKIERFEALENLDAILQVSDGVMVARGDLAVEIGEENIPRVQKEIIQRAREMDRIVITATQMMESMIEANSPTRAEVSDVANAVLDGTDAVMLSAESAVGRHPARVVEAMARICLASEKSPRVRISKHRVECQFERVDEAIAMAAMYTANHLNVRAIIAMTESGATPLWMSRIHSAAQIYGLSRNDLTLGKMTLMRGVYPMFFDSTAVDKIRVNASAADLLAGAGFLREGDLAILTSGDHMGFHGGTNKMKVIRIGSVA